MITSLLVIKKNKIIDSSGIKKTTYTASPEEVPSVFQHGIDIDKLSLSDGDESAVSRIVVLQRSSYQDRVCAGAEVMVRFTLSDTSFYAELKN